jgi:transcriptional regulator with XRE-family HTH domain
MKSVSKHTNWTGFKKTLHLTKEGMELAQAKLMLSELIFDLRLSKKMSQKELARVMGVSQPYIAKIEDGEENLTIETIVKLFSALGMRLEIRPGKRVKSETILNILKAA